MRPLRLPEELMSDLAGEAGVWKLAPRRVFPPRNWADDGAKSDSVSPSNPLRPRLGIFSLAGDRLTTSISLGGESQCLSRRGTQNVRAGSHQKLSELLTTNGQKQSADIVPRNKLDLRPTTLVFFTDIITVVKHECKTVPFLYFLLMFIYSRVKVNKEYCSRDHKLTGPYG